MMKSRDSLDERATIPAFMLQEKLWFKPESLKGIGEKSRLNPDFFSTLLLWNIF